MNLFLQPKQLLLLLFLISGLCFSSLAQTIKGRVTDAATKEPMVGATILLKETGKSQVVQLDGYFTFKNLKADDYTLEVRFVSYNTKLLKVSVTDDKVSTVNVALESNTKELSTVNVNDNGESTDKRARTLEKNANQVVNIVSAKNIEISPDVTVANVIQRVSGVTIERSNSGEGRYPIIR
jgi:outer membrane receptor protein involved in Fe transport